jgi:tetratricopeptide (TPR) repeat protein
MDSLGHPQSDQMFRQAQQATSVSLLGTGERTKMSEAEDWFQKGVEFFEARRYDDAMPCFDRVLEINPRHEKAWAKKGVVLHNLDRLEEAVNCYARALEIDASDKSAWLGKGETLRRLGRLEEAQPCLERAGVSDPLGDVIAAYERDSRSPEDALSRYDRALELNPRDHEAWNNKGNALVGLGRLEESLSCYDQAFQINPRLAAACHNKGLTLWELGRLEEALVSLERADSLGALAAPQAIREVQKALSASRGQNQATDRAASKKKAEPVSILGRLFGKRKGP